MTAGTPTVTAFPRIERLLEALGLRKRKARKQPPFIDLHLHDPAPTVTLQTVDGANVEMRLLGACLAPGHISLHYVVIMPTALSIRRVRVAHGNFEKWDDMPQPVDVPEGAAFRFTVTFGWGEEPIDKSDHMDAGSEP